MHQKYFSKIIWKQRITLVICVTKITTLQYYFISEGNITGEGFSLQAKLENYIPYVLTSLAAWD